MDKHIEADSVSILLRKNEGLSRRIYDWNTLCDAVVYKCDAGLVTIEKDKETDREYAAAYYECDENKFELLDVCSESEIHIVPTGKPHIRHHEALMVGRVVRGMYGGIWDSYSLIPHFLVGHDY